MEYRLDLAQALYAMQQAPIGILAVSSDNQIIFANNCLRQFLSLDNNALEGQNFDALPPAYLKAITESRDNVLLPGDDTHPSRCLRLWQHAGGSSARLYFSVDASEEHQLREERERLTTELSNLTTRDAETGLPNRISLLESLEPLISRSRRYNNPLTIIRLKIDNAAGYDPLFGAGSQKQALVAVARLLKDQLRWADIVGRWEDDEFLLILPETPESAGAALRDKITARVAELDIVSPKGSKFRPQPRCGIASWTKGDDAKKLLQRSITDI